MSDDVSEAAVEAAARDLFLVDVFGPSFADNTHGQVPSRIRAWERLKEDDESAVAYDSTMLTCKYEYEGEWYVVGKESFRKKARIVLMAAAQARASAAETEIAARLLEAERRGAEAMRERAAKVADGHDGKLRGGGCDYGPNVGPKIATAIRALPATEPQS